MSPNVLREFTIPVTLLLAPNFQLRDHKNQPKSATGRVCARGCLQQTHSLQSHLPSNSALFTWSPLFCMCPQEQIPLGLQFIDFPPRKSWGLVAQSLAHQERAERARVAGGGWGGLGGRITVSIFKFRSLLNESQERISPPLSQTNHRPPR